MFYLAAYLYVAGMPVAVHLTDEITLNVRRKDRVIVALVWPLLLPVYLYGVASLVWTR